MTDLVSVIIPTYNRTHFLMRAVSSVLNQTYSNIELIVVDDGSTDDTIEVLQRIQDPRLTYYRINNSGAPVARNYGMERSKGEFVTFLDSDDEYLPNKVEKQVEVFRTSELENLGVVSCGRLDYRNDELYFKWIPRHRGNVLDVLLSKKRVGAGTPFLMISRAVVNQGIFFDPDMPAGQDFDFLVRVCMNFQFDYSPCHLVRVNHHSGERIYNSERALKATELQLEKYRDIIMKTSSVYESFMVKYADLAFTYGNKQKALNLLKGLGISTFRVRLWYWYMSTFDTPRSKTSLALLKLLRTVS